MSMRERLEALKERPEFAAAGSRWTQEEEARVVDAIAGGRTIMEVAAGCKRTHGSIRAKLLALALRMVDAEGRSAEDVCAMLSSSRLQPVDIDAERARQRAKWDDNDGRESEQRRKKDSKDSKDSKETFTDVLKDIRDILRRLEERL